MLNQCFNPECGKPLHYLREGRVFVFGVHTIDEGEHGEGSRLEHYWLCGACAERFALAQDGEVIRMVQRKVRPRTYELELPEHQALAS
ncbi:MAG: hypothetical protein ACP5M4_07080 [Acidobacteriaceae bacterium]